MINIILLIITFSCLGGIFYILLKKILFLSKINLSDTTADEISEIKKRLLLKKVDRKINKIKDSFYRRILLIKKYIQKINVFFKKTYLILKYIFKKLTNLDFFRKLAKIRESLKHSHKSKS